MDREGGLQSGARTGSAPSAFHPGTSMRIPSMAALLSMSLLSGNVPAANLFCGGPVPQTDEPTDLAHVVGDQTLEYMADQPASMVVCSKGYLFEKCGDHETAMRIFDRCIEAGYVGAMIWKALMLQDGALGKPDLPAAAELMRRAAQSGDSPYATLGKLHYASALHEGKGVPRDVTAARSWFEAAAAEGNPDAIEFLRTGYHVGDRDGQARGVGDAPPVAGAAPLPGVLLEEAAVPGQPASPARPARAPVAPRLVSEAHRLVAEAATPPATPSAPLAQPRLTGQRLAPVSPDAPVAAWMQSAALTTLLLTLTLIGAFRQRRGRPLFLSHGA